MQCGLCKRDVKSLTKHHLFPRCRHQRHKEDLSESVVELCRECHDMIHAVFTETELDKRYNDLDVIRAHPSIEKWLKWIEGKPDRCFGIKRSKRRR